MSRTESLCRLVITRWTLSVKSPGGAAAWRRIIRVGVGALPLADASIDFAIAAHLLGHLPWPVAALAAMWRGLFCLIRLTAIGHNASAGAAGKELNP